MAYSPLPSKNASDTLTLANYNAIKGNFEASAIDIVTAKGDLVIATAADALARLGIGNDDDILVPDAGEATGLVWQIQPMCRVYNNAAIDPATSSWVTLTFNTERHDTNGMHSTVSNTGRLTAPSGGGGIYLLGGCAECDFTGETGSVGLRLLLNGTTVIAQNGLVRITSTASRSLSIETVYILSVTDYVELQVYTTMDVDVAVQSNYSPEFWAIWMRRA
jgi:hypothetical protein